MEKSCIPAFRPGCLVLYKEWEVRSQSKLNAMSILWQTCSHTYWLWLQWKPNGKLGVRIPIPTLLFVFYSLGTCKAGDLRGSLNTQFEPRNSCAVCNFSPQNYLIQHDLDCICNTLSLMCTLHRLLFCFESCHIASETYLYRNEFLTQHEMW